MTEPTPTEYAAFGAAVAGILDAATLTSAPDEFTVSMIRTAAETYNIKSEVHA